MGTLSSNKPGSELVPCAGSGGAVLQRPPRVVADGRGAVLRLPLLPLPREYAGRARGARNRGEPPRAAVEATTRESDRSEMPNEGRNAGMENRQDFRLKNLDRQTVKTTMDQPSECYWACT